MDFGVAGCRRLWLAALTETMDLVWAEAVDFESAAGRPDAMHDGCEGGLRVWFDCVQGKCRSEYVPIKAN